jgi:hypothetical protein
MNDWITQELASTTGAGAASGTAPPGSAHPADGGTDAGKAAGDAGKAAADAGPKK